jgi:hypothetical protein
MSGIGEDTRGQRQPTSSLASGRMAVYCGYRRLRQPNAGHGYRVRRSIALVSTYALRRVHNRRIHRWAKTFGMSWWRKRLPYVDRADCVRLTTLVRYRPSWSARGPIQRTAVVMTNRLSRVIRITMAAGGSRLSASKRTRRRRFLRFGGMMRQTNFALRTWLAGGRSAAMWRRGAMSDRRGR